MPGIIIVDDSFTGLANNVTIHNRIPPITDSSNAYRLENSAWAVGGGSEDIKFVGTGVAVKIQVASINGAVQITADPNGGNESYAVFTRDAQTTPYPRWGYYAGFKPALSQISVAVITDFTKSYLLNSTPWTYNTSGPDTLALESVGNNHRVIINNVVAHSFTDSTYSSATNNQFGIVYNSTGNPSVVRVNRFSVLDSIVTQGALTYTIVTVS